MKSRRFPLVGRHVVPVKADLGVEQVPRVDVGEPERISGIGAKVRACARVHEGLEIQTVSELVKHDGHEVIQCTVIVVDAEIEVEVAAESRADVW